MPAEPSGAGGGPVYGAGQGPEYGQGAEYVPGPAAGPGPVAGTARPAVREPGGRPVVTTSIARPEGGGRAAGGDAPAPARQWPILLVIAGTAIGLIITASGAFRSGTIVVGASLLVGAALRWAVTAVGMLAVRSRFTDVITYGVLGLAIVLLALMAQPSPLIRIPFLEDVIHFGVR